MKKPTKYKKQKKHEATILRPEQERKRGKKTTRNIIAVDLATSRQSNANPLKPVVVLHSYFAWGYTLFHSFTGAVLKSLRWGLCAVKLSIWSVISGWNRQIWYVSGSHQHFNPFQYEDVFSKHFCILFTYFIQLKKLVWGIKGWRMSFLTLYLS